MEKKNIKTNKEQTKTMTSIEVPQDALYILNLIRTDFYHKAWLSLAMSKQFYWDRKTDTIKCASVPVIYLRPREGYNNIAWRELYKYYLTREIVDYYKCEFGVKLRTEIIESVESCIKGQLGAVQYLNGDDLVFVVSYDETLSKTIVGIDKLYFEVRFDKKKGHVYHVGNFGFIKAYMDKDGKIFRMKGCFSLNFDRSRIEKRTERLEFKNIDAKKHHYMRYIVWQRT